MRGTVGATEEVAAGAEESDAESAAGALGGTVGATKRGAAGAEEIEAKGAAGARKCARTPGAERRGRGDEGRVERGGGFGSQMHFGREAVCTVVTERLAGARRPPGGPVRRARPRDI